MHLFAGAGGGILGGLLCGHKPVCAVEIEPYPRKVLIQRQQDGMLPHFPIWDDVCTFDGKPWRGTVEVICGGFPCQDISSAGKGAGITGARSGLWKEYARIIDEVRPQYVFAENSPLLRTRGLGVVLEDLASMGYDARWGVLGAWHAGAPHKRDRMWVLAHANLSRDRAPECGVDQDGQTQEQERGVKSQPKPGGLSEAMANASSIGQQGQGESWYAFDPAESEDGETDMSFHERVGKVWGIKSPVGRVAHGVANRMGRLKAIGNGQVPGVARLAWEVMSSNV
jgi:DNA (cytosine-5)-methyltransferase 1